MIELLAVLVIAGLLAIALLPRFADVDVFRQRGYFEQALAATRYARKLATASGCSIAVAFEAAGDRLSITRWNGGTDCTERSGARVPVAQPGGGGDLVVEAPGGVDVTNDLVFFFDRVGRPHDLAGTLITDPAALRVGIGARLLQVTPETGLVTGS